MADQDVRAASSITPSVPPQAHETIYQNSALASPTLHRPLMLAGRREEDFQGSIKSGRDHAESCMESRNERGTAGRLLPRMCSMRCAKNIQRYR
jgi:hypothetical protein